MPWAKCAGCGTIVRYPGWRGFKLSSTKCPRCSGKLKRIRLSKKPSESYIDLSAEWRETLEFAQLI